jgi:hypothetical protein
MNTCTNYEPRIVECHRPSWDKMEVCRNCGGLPHRSDHAGDLARLLEISVCPNTACTDGCIAHQIADNEWEAEQCQWCYEKNTALTNYREATK